MRAQRYDLGRCSNPVRLAEASIRTIKRLHFAGRPTRGTTKSRTEQVDGTRGPSASLPIIVGAVPTPLQTARAKSPLRIAA